LTQDKQGAIAFVLLIPFLCEAAPNSILEESLQHSLKASFGLAHLHIELV
jgi:hypothetical protein